MGDLRELCPSSLGERARQLRKRSMLRSLGTPFQQQYEDMWTTSLNPHPLGEEFVRTWNSCPPRKRMCHGKNTQTCHFRAFSYAKGFEIRNSGTKWCYV